MKKFVIIIAAILAVSGIYYYTSRLAEAPSDTQLAQEGTGEIKTEIVKYFGEVSGYLALPATSGKHPAIILIHEWWGLNDDIRAMAERYAREGYVALAVDLYNGESTTDQTRARELVGKVRENTVPAFENLKAAVAYLKTRVEVETDKLASVGWCFGGGWSYEMAVNNLGVLASVMYYGQFDPEDDFEHMKADILGHFGEKDASITIDKVNEFQAKLKTLKGEHEVYIYPNVGHGFANVRGGNNTAYNEEASELAWMRTQEFLNRIFEE
jgi:carboxymethylenebutenolidase